MSRNTAGSKWCQEKKYIWKQKNVRYESFLSSTVWIRAQINPVFLRVSYKRENKTNGSLTPSQGSDLFHLRISQASFLNQMYGHVTCVKKMVVWMYEWKKYLVLQNDWEKKGSHRVCMKMVIRFRHCHLQFSIWNTRRMRTKSESRGAFKANKV